jgi:hypothetical protein
MNEIEQKAKVNLTAPRVTLEDIESNIVSEHYFTAADGVKGAPADNPDAVVSTVHG